MAFFVAKPPLVNMAAKGPKPLQIAVCGCTSSVYMHHSQQGQGAGKSVLCNRFMRPNADELLTTHPSVLNHSDYGGTVVNNTHFLYWGEKTVGMDNGEEVKIQIIEHTEFIDDATLKPFSYPKPYYKRCAQLKVQSGGKVSYVHPDQLSLPENYKATSFPDKFLIDGFLVCVDVSCENTGLEADFAESLLTSLVALKKPIVVVLTKYDIAKPNTVQAMQDVVAKMKKQAPPIIEVSALKGVNVDLCFLLLTHLIDSKKPSSRVVTYAVAKQHLDERIMSCERSFQDLLDRELNDFALPLEPALNKFSGSVEFRLVVELCGSQRARKLVQAKLNYVKKQQVQKMMDEFVARIPRVLAELLPDLDLEATPNSCREKLKQMPNFSAYFCEEKNWEENILFLARSNPNIPFSFMNTDSRATDQIRVYIEKVLLPKRQKLAYDRLKSALTASSQLKPGTEMDLLFKDLGLEQDAKLQSRETLAQLYREKMTEVEAECTKNFEELLLERVDLFDIADTALFSTVIEKLKDDPAFKRFEYTPNVRQSVILKFISHLQYADKGPYSKSHFVPYLDEASLDKDNLYTSKQWVWDNTEDTYINIAIIAQQEQSATYLQNDIKTLCGNKGLLELDGYTYRPEIAIFHGDVTTLTSEEFAPQCAILVVNSAQCLDWMDVTVRTLFIPGENTLPSYRGMPIIIVAIDLSYGEASSTANKDSLPDNDFYKRVKNVANALQCVVFADKPTPFPQRLVFTSQIDSLMRAMINAVIQSKEILCQPLSITSKGFNVAVCALPDTSCSPELALAPLVNHQLLTYKGSLFARVAIEKQHRTCTFTFHSAINVTEIKSVPRIGYLLIYSTSKKATLSALKWLKPQLHNIPTLVVAMRSVGALDNQLLEEGQEYAEKNGCMFMTSEHWKVGSTAAFFNKCWFSRLSSWKAQCPSDELKRKDRALPDPRPLPELPPIPDPLSSIPVAVGPVPEFTKHSPSLPLRNSYLEEEITSPTTPSLLSPTHTFPTLPQSPSRSAFIRTPKEQSPEDSLYSNPQEIATKEFGTLQRNRRSHIPVLAMDEPGAESEYSTVVDHKKMKRKPAGPSLSLEGGTSLKSPEEEQKSSPSIIRRTFAKLSPEPQRFRSSASKKIPSPGPGEEDILQSPTRKNEYPAEVHEERTARKLKTPVASPFSSPVMNRKTPQRDSGTVQPVASSRDTSPEGMYAEINVKRKVSLPEVFADTTHRSLGGMSKDTESLRDRGLLIPEGGNGSLQRSPKVAQKALPKAAPPLIKPKPAPDMYAAVIPKPKKPQVASTEDQVPLLKGGDQLERDTTEDEEGSTYAQVNKPKGANSRGTSTPSKLVKDTADEESSNNTYAAVQKNPKKSNRKSSTGDERTTPPADVGTQQRGKLERDTEGVEGGDNLYAAVQPKPKKRVSGSDDSTPLLGSPSPADPPAPLRKMNSVPRYDHLLFPQQYDHLPSDQCHEDKEQSSETEPLQQGEALYAMPAPKKKLPPAATNPKPRLSLSTEDEEKGRLVTENPEDDDEDEDENEDQPSIPARNYDPEELEASPPLPPRKYSFSDFEDNDEEVISDNEQDIQEISTADQQAIYASVCQQYQKQKSEAHESQQFTALYDTLENMKKETKGTKPAVPTTTPSGSATLLPGIPPETVFTPQQLKVIKQQQKLLAQLQKKMEKEQERRRKQEEKRKQKEREEQEKKMGKGRRKAKGKKQERVRYFSSPLEQVSGEDGIPVFVKKCVAYVEEKGLKVEGIYRISGKKEDVLSLQDKFDEDNNLVIDPNVYCEAAVSSTLKAFFKLLPSPLIVDVVAAKMLSIVQSGLELPEQRTKTQEVLRTLPRCNLNTLHFLVEHLHVVQRHAEKNKMNASNLAIVFWPTLMRPPILDLADPSKQMGWQLAMMRIIEHPDFVPSV